MQLTKIRIIFFNTIRAPFLYKIIVDNFQFSNASIGH